MNNKNFIQELSLRTGFKQEETQRMVYSVIDAMNGKFQKGETHGKDCR